MNFIRDFVGRIRIKLNKRTMRKSVITAGLCGAGAALVIMLFALIIPIYYALYIAAGLFVLGLAIGVVFGIKKRIGNKEAALFVDSCGFDEKIVTALENAEYADRVCMLQREDAEASLRARGNEVKVPYDFPWIRLSLLLITIVLCAGVYFIPTKAKKLAEDRHAAKLAAKEAEEEVEELIEALSKIDEGQLSEEELAELEKLMESLSVSGQEFSDAKSMNDFNSASEKYDYKLNEVQEKLDQLASGKSGEVNQQIKDASEIAGNQQSAEGKQTASNSQNGEGEGSESGESQNGEGSESGEGQSGEGEGSGSGEGEGEGSSSGSGSGTGSGQSSGGAEEKAVEHNHDYVSVDSSITGDYGDNSTSEYAHEQNGLAWEGTQVPYDSVINEYSEQAYEGIEKGQYPSTMSDVIKDYFSSLSE